MRSSSNIIKHSEPSSLSPWCPQEMIPTPAGVVSKEGDDLHSVSTQSPKPSYTVPDLQDVPDFIKELGQGGEISSANVLKKSTVLGNVKHWSPQQILPETEKIGTNPTSRDNFLWLKEEARKEAQRIVEQATSQAKEIIREASERAIQITYQAYKDGFSEGKEKAGEEAGKLLQMARKVLEETCLWRQEVLSKSERAVIDMVKDIALKVFGEGVVLDAMVLKRAFERALSEAKTLGYLRLHLHPEDMSLIEPVWLQNQMVVIGQQIDLVPDEEVQRGGCFIEGQFGSVDARVGSQLQAVFDKLSEVVSNSQENDE